MAKCNICNRRWWFSAQVKCDCKSKQLKQRVVVAKGNISPNTHEYDWGAHSHIGVSAKETTSSCESATQHFSQPRQESSSYDASSSYDNSGSSSSSGWD